MSGSGSVQIRCARRRGTPNMRSRSSVTRSVVSSTSRSGWGGLLRRAIAPRLRWVPALRDRLLDSETPPLSRSELVDRRRFRKSLNGRLCPNAPLTNDVRYDDVTRGGFVFVTGVPLSPEQRAALAGHGTEVLEVAPGSALYKWLADGKAAAALVRPDFTVLRVGRDVTSLCEAAPRFLIA